MSKILCTTLAALLLTAMAASAHHAFAAEYDESKTVTITGTVTAIEWTNPHAWLHIDGKDESGKAVTWSFEMGSPNGLQRRGWSRNAVKVGEQITIQGFRAKDGRNVANAATVTLPGGGKLFGGFQSTPGAPR